MKMRIRMNMKRALCGLDKNIIIYIGIQRFHINDINRNEITLVYKIKAWIEFEHNENESNYCDRSDNTRLCKH